MEREPAADAAVEAPGAAARREEGTGSGKPSRASEGNTATPAPSLAPARFHRWASEDFAADPWGRAAEDLVGLEIDVSGGEGRVAQDLGKAGGGGCGSRPRRPRSIHVCVWPRG